MRHEHGEVCPSCTLKISQTHPDLESWFSWIKFSHPEAHISWSYRGKEDQDRMVREGKSFLSYPASKHNSTKPDGTPQARALDLFQLINGKAVFDIEWYKKINEETKKSGFKLVWGGEFKKLKDFNHFEMV